MVKGGNCMLNTTVKTIMPNVSLRCIRTDKFKTAIISVNFITPLSSKTVSKTMLLPSVLLRGCVSHPDMESLSLYQEELYGTTLEPIIRKKGEVLSMGIYAGFVDDDFLPAGENLLEKVAALLGEIILSPETRGGLLLADYVESEKVNLIDKIRGLKNDKMSYAVQLLIENMCKNEAYGTPRFGTEAQVQAINARSLTKHYRETIATSKVEIVYCGASNPERVELAIVNAFSSLPRRGEVTVPETEVIYTQTGDVKSVTDQFEVVQGKLSMGFRIGEILKNTDKAKLMVFNDIFGGDANSKLFANVREKLSLCYYASSYIEDRKGIMVVCSGVDKANFKAAYDEILAQLDAVRSGDFTQDELDTAKSFIISQLKSRLDTVGGLEGLYFDMALSDDEITPDKLITMTGLVKAEDVIAIAKSIWLDTVHYIEPVGGEQDEE